MTKRIYGLINNNFPINTTPESFYIIDNLYRMFFVNCCQACTDYEICKSLKIERFRSEL
jgi:hypothetical protein